MDSIINRHERIALQFSGGRDSIACLYMMRDYWDRLTVYWCNPGDAFPETREVMDSVRDLVPHFVEVAGDQPGVIQLHGIPSDLVPASHTPVGLIASHRGGQLIQDRYSCCLRSRIIPMQERMIADGVTLVIRGQKDSDRLKWNTRSGDVMDGVEYLFPIEDWSTKDVMDYLAQEGAPMPRFYDMLDGAPDCMTCSAYWENGAAKYLKQYHPIQFHEVQRRLDAINQAVASGIVSFNVEISS